MQLRDAYLNDITTGGETVALFTDLGSLSGVADNGDGTYTATLTSSTTGLATITGTANGYWLVDIAQVTVIKGGSRAVEVEAAGRRPLCSHGNYSVAPGNRSDIGRESDAHQRAR